MDKSRVSYFFWLMWYVCVWACVCVCQMDHVFQPMAHHGRWFLMRQIAHHCHMFPTSPTWSTTTFLTTLLPVLCQFPMVQSHRPAYMSITPARCQPQVMNDSCFVRAVLSCILMLWFLCTGWSEIFAVKKLLKLFVATEVWLQFDFDSTAVGLFIKGHHGHSVTWSRNTSLAVGPLAAVMLTYLFIQASV